MSGSLSGWEFVVSVVVVLLLVGGRKFGELARGLGEGIRMLRTAGRGEERRMETPGGGGGVGGGGGGARRGGGRCRAVSLGCGVVGVAGRAQGGVGGAGGQAVRRSDGQ